MISAAEARARWRGVLAPLVTPFSADGSVDFAALRRNVEWLIGRGATDQNTVLLAAGSGGDFTSMNVEERKQVIATVAEVAAGRIPVIAGVQSLDVRDTIAICQACESLPVDAVQISGPFYYDGRPGDVIAWMELVARHTRIGLAVYNNWYTGYDMPLDLVEELVDMPSTVAVKWASPNVDIFLEGVRRFQSRVAVVNNTFNTVIGHMVGSKVFVSHWPNYYPEFCWRLWGLMEAQLYHQAQEEFDRVNRPYQALVARIARQTGGEGVFVRPAMALVGLEGGVSRLPSRDEAVTPEIREEFRKILVQAGALGAASSR
jgi:4-hydroxy-tetrahydrodipicolinate synthase